MNADAHSSDLETMRFEDLLDMLESLIRELSDSAVGIERAAELYEQADLVHKAASKKLDQVGVRLSQVQGTSDAQDLEDSWQMGEGTDEK